MKHGVLLVGCGAMVQVHCTVLANAKRLKPMAGMMERFRPMFLKTRQAPSLGSTL